MTEKTKITLSAKELELVCNKEWILTKQIVIDKVYQLFGSLALSMQQLIAEQEASASARIAQANPKISRGENYEGLPYVMLDYPRSFSKDSIQAIRCFFWWGNFFSITLHLSGKQKEAGMPLLLANFEILKESDYLICVNSNEWEHHFESDNYRPLKEFSAVEFGEKLSFEPFIKIAKKIHLQYWDNAGEFLEYHFKELIKLL